MAYNAVYAKMLKQGGFGDKKVRVLAGEAGTLTNAQKYKAWIHAGVPPKEAYLLAFGSPTANQKRKALRHAGFDPRRGAYLVANGAL